MMRIDAGSIGQFQVTMERMKELVPQRLDLFVKAFVQTVFNEIQSAGRHSPGTPVADPTKWNPPRPPESHIGGFARASWQGGLNSMPQHELDASLMGAPEVTAVLTASIRKNESIALEAKAGDRIYFVNYAPYIRRLEFGWSQQAPEGMVRVTILNAQAIADEVATHILENM